MQHWMGTQSKSNCCTDLSFLSGTLSTMLSAVHWHTVHKASHISRYCHCSCLSQSGYSLWGVTVGGFVIVCAFIVQVTPGASQLLRVVWHRECFRGNRHIVDLWGKCHTHEHIWKKILFYMLTALKCIRTAKNSRLADTRKKKNQKFSSFSKKCQIFVTSRYSMKIWCFSLSTIIVKGISLGFGIFCWSVKTRHLTTSPWTMGNYNKHLSLFSDNL